MKSNRKIFVSQNLQKKRKTPQNGMVLWGKKFATRINVTAQKSQIIFFFPRGLQSVMYSLQTDMYSLQTYNHPTVRQSLARTVLGALPPGTRVTFSKNRVCNHGW
jgi:hypothetical protein